MADDFNARRDRLRRERARFDRAWPWMVALATMTAIAVLVLIAAGVLPVWVLFL